MGQAYSAEDYSEWERTYVTPQHNGSTVCMMLIPMKEETGQYDKDKAIDPDNIPLLQVHGVLNVGNLKLTWEKPLVEETSITFQKISFADVGGRLDVSFKLPPGSTELDLSQHRALFVAYLDSLTTLKLQLDDAEQFGAMHLSSELIPDRNDRTKMQVQSMTVRPDGTTSGMKTTVFDDVGDLSNQLGGKESSEQ